MTVEKRDLVASAGMEMVVEKEWEVVADAAKGSASCLRYRSA